MMLSSDTRPPMEDSNNRGSIAGGSDRSGVKVFRDPALLAGRLRTECAMRKWAPLVAVCLGTFMLLIDISIVNVALPDLTRDLDAAFSQLQWVFDSYALALAALLLGAGSIADAIGLKRVYLAGLTLFALASLACGTAPTIEWLIAARTVQGVGGAAMFATTIALINVSYQGRERGSAFGVWGAVSGAGAGAGVVVGGVLTDLLSWHWVFLVNLP